MTPLNQVTETPKSFVDVKTELDFRSSQRVVAGIEATFVIFLLRFQILIIALRSYRRPRIALQVLKGLIREKKRILGDSFSRRFVKLNSRYYWSFLTPGWPSKAFTKFIQNELMRARPFKQRTNHLQILIFGITNKCGLRCEHCFEWDNLDSKEALTPAQLQQIIHKFQENGVTQIQLSGGEPLNRFDDMINLLEKAKTGTDFWLLTSGFGFTLKKAQRLKQAGLTGVTLSLDHWNEDEHNRFRGNEKSFHWAQKAVVHCHKVDLPVTLSICATREFVTHEDLWKYLALANDMGIAFVRILEPKPVGHYAAKDIKLTAAQVAVLKEFYVTANSDVRYAKWPVVLYPGFHQREYNCFGGGDRFLYVDSRGEIHACPFCQASVGNALTMSVDDAISQLQAAHACLEFEQSPLKMRTV